MYQDTIGLGDEFSFGVEIEFGGVKLMSLYPQLLKESIPVYYNICHKSNHPNYDTWYLDGDASVSRLINHDIVGGELSSKILTDTVDCWKELKKVCHVLKEEHAEANSYTSTHITVDISKYLDNPEFFETFSKILSVYEIDMSLFYMGDQYLLRRTKNKFASSMSSRLQENLPKVDFHSRNYLDSLMDVTKCFQLRDGVNFTKLKYQGLIEIRYPNGTLEEETIQNNINFTLKLFQAIEEKKFDNEYLDYLLENDVKDPRRSYRINYYFENPDRFDELIQQIGNENDQKSFSMQYQKVLRTKN